TFAAANPFEEVPAEHSAYDAIAQHAADGVIEGYGDGTYRGDQEITRYEMAQMIARAMAKGGNGADKALIDKLAAEFADELNNLGVRVAALEKKVDNVKWTGKIRYRYINRHEERNTDRAADGGKGNVNGLLLRLEPQMQINKNWTAKARIDYNSNTEMNDAANMTGNQLTVDRAWVEGKYNNFVLKLGKFNVATQADYSMTMFYRIAGAEAQFGKDVKVAVRGGRLNLTNSNAFAHGGISNGFGIDRHYGPTVANDVDGAYTYHQRGGQTASYMGLEVFNDRAKKFTWGLGWQHVRGDGNNNLQAIGSNINIFNLGLGWKFDKNVQVRGAYAFATGIKNNNDGGRFDSKGYKNAASLEVLYKGAVASKPNSWGFNIAYRHLGDVATIYPYAKEFGPQNGGEKGFEIGVSYTFLKNIVGNAKYFNGKELLSGHKTNTVWTELNFIF
ncbi:MAG: S-layer homology domain-containing protein, partial [Schwartzia sp.]|nr:S-layer homology domain-containing protein [Schwartzia sp. (in: firmicutes)]